MAVADASFSTVIDSMSFGLIAFSGLRGRAAFDAVDRVAPATVVLVLERHAVDHVERIVAAVIDVPPRMRICAPPPGSPLFVVMLHAGDATLRASGSRS